MFDQLLSTLLKNFEFLDLLLSPILELFPLFHWQFLISHILFRLSKVWNMLHYGTMEWVQEKECFVMFLSCFDTTSLFFIIKCVLLWFSILFLMKIKFPQDNIKQSERNWRSEIASGALCFIQSSLTLDRKHWWIYTYGSVLLTRLFPMQRW